MRPGHIDNVGRVNACSSAQPLRGVCGRSRATLTSMKFAVYATWACGVNADAILAAFNAAFRPADEGVCAWVPDDRPEALQLSFDVEASDSDDGLRSAMAEVASAAQEAATPGQLVELVVMTDEGQARWMK